MLYRTVTAAFMLLLLALPAHAQQPFSLVGEAGQWLTNYYKHPEPERLADALIILTNPDSGVPEDGQKLIYSFIGAALVQAPEEQDHFFNAVAQHKRTKLLALPCFWFMGKAGKPLLERAKKEWTDPNIANAIQQFAKSPAPKLLDGPVKNALHLDHLWSIFFATGKPEPVLKIISALAYIGNEYMEPHILGVTAQWSLRANARTHPRVREIIKATLPKLQDPLKSRLTETLENKKS